MLSFTAIGNYGRFGNQLFQYSSVYGIAQKRSFEFWIPRNSSCSLEQVFDGLLVKDNTKEFQAISNIFREPVGGATVFFPEAFEVQDNTSFWGYFQSPKYFTQSENDLKKHLNIKSNFLEQANSFIANNGVEGFIHIRRGDYLTSCGGNCHPVITTDYIKKATELSKAKKFVIISDDMNWCKQNLKNFNVVFSPFSDKHFGYDFALMTQCKSAIIANSSFSWWGAWLGKTKDVIAPAMWFGKDTGVPQEWKDVYCEGWSII